MLRCIALAEGEPLGNELLYRDSLKSFLVNLIGDRPRCAPPPVDPEHSQPFKGAKLIVGGMPLAQCSRIVEVTVELHRTQP